MSRRRRGHHDRTRRRDPSRGFRQLLMRILAQMDRTQPWLSKRSGVTVPAINKILNGRRWPSELQALRIAGGIYCSEDELTVLLMLDEIDTAMSHLLKEVAKRKISAERISEETRIGIATVRRFLANELRASEEERVRIFLAITIRDTCRRAKVNELLEAAGDYVFGSCDAS